MDRRDALKALGSVVAATGMTVTPVTAKEIDHVELVLLRVRAALVSRSSLEHIQEHWKMAVHGTGLQDVKVLVMSSDVDVEFVRR